MNRTGAQFISLQSCSSSGLQAEENVNVIAMLPRWRLVHDLVAELCWAGVARVSGYRKACTGRVSCANARGEGVEACAVSVVVSHVVYIFFKLKKNIYNMAHHKNIYTTWLFKS